MVRNTKSRRESAKWIVGLLAGSSGCLARLNPQNGGSTKPEPVAVRFENLDNIDHRMSVKIQREGEKIVFNETATVSAGKVHEGKFVPPTEVTSYTATASLDGGESKEYQFNAGSGSGTTSVILRVDETGTLDITHGLV